MLRTSMGFKPFGVAALYYAAATGRSSGRLPLLGPRGVFKPRHGSSAKRGVLQGSRRSQSHGLQVVRFGPTSTAPRVPAQHEFVASPFLYERTEYLVGFSYHIQPRVVGVGYPVLSRLPQHWLPKSSASALLPSERALSWESTRTCIRA